MKIGVIGPQFPDSFADNVTSSLRRMGHEADALGSTYRISSSRIGAIVTQLSQSSMAASMALQRRVVAQATRRDYDVVISLEANLVPEAVNKIRQNGSAVTLWFPDSIGLLGRQLMFLSDYDLLCFKDSELVSRVSSMLASNVIYLPEACNPEWHRPCDAELEEIVLVAGNMSAFRMRLLERLVRAGLPLRIYGPRWARWLKSDLLEPLYTGTYLAGAEKARAFRSAGVLLNQLHITEMASMNCRLFEAAGCGAAVLTEVRADLEGLFVPENEVATFDTFDALVERVRWLLDHPDEAREMGDRAATRAHSAHTYDLRLEKLLTSL